MLAVSTQRSNNNSSFDCGKNGDIHMEISCVAANNINNDCSAGFSRDDVVDFPSDFSATGNLLDSIDFDDLFAGINHGHGPGNAEDELPDLEIDPQELLAEFSGLSGGGDGGEDSFSCGNYDINYSNYAMIGGGGRGGCNYDIINDHNDNNNSNEFNNHDGNYVMNYAITINVGNSGGEGEDKVSSSATEKCKQDLEAAEIESKKTELELISSPANNSDTTTTNNNNRVDRGGKKLSPKGKNNNANNSLSNIGGGSSSTHGKRKTKVDWTPELHRRFVQAVEQLGVDKAVPSRILELMDIDCLTRHNVASHLQKYRSHRRHLLAKEAEAASWTHKRQIYGVAVAPSAAAPVAGTSTGKAGGRTASHSHPWNGATMGFPHPTMPPQPMHHHHPNHHLSFRPLHVWGHPTHHQIETRHHHQSMMHMWPKHPPPPPPPPPHHAFWHSHHQRRFAASPAVPSIIPPPPHPATMYSHNHKRHQDTPAANPPLDFHPTKESVDAAIGDVLCKPWLPLPLGLKPPSVDSVLVELQRQGIPKIPPLSTSTAPTTDHLESS